MFLLQSGEVIYVDSILDTAWVAYRKGVSCSLTNRVYLSKYGILTASKGQSSLHIAR